MKMPIDGQKLRIKRSLISKTFTLMFINFIFLSSLLQVDELSVLCRASNNTAIFLDPQEIHFRGLIENRTFTVRVKISDVKYLFGYEFKVLWNATLMDVVNVKLSPPDIWGSSYFIAKDEINHTGGVYWHAITAIPPARDFSGNLTVAILTFKVVYTPIYPERIRSEIKLIDTKLSDSNGNMISHIVSWTAYSYDSIEPMILLEPSFIKINSTSEKLALRLLLVNVTCLYHFYVKIAFNNSLIKVVDFQLNRFLQEPYNIQSVGFNQENGNIWIEFESKPPAQVVNGTAVVLKIFLTVANVSVPFFDSTVLIQESFLKTKTGLELQHKSRGAFIIYRPILGDLNSDGKVNVNDLYLIARHYGSRQGEANWDERADMNGDGVIDVVDMVVLINYFDG